MNRLPAFAAPIRTAMLHLLIGICALQFSAAQAQPTPNPPERMTYQGFLVDGNGVALGNTAPKNYDVVFKIWTDQTGGTLLWGEQQTVTVDKGYFTVLLGEGANVGDPQPALSTLFKGTTASDRYVSFTVKGVGPGGANVDILPRLRLLTSPYSYLASQAMKLVKADGADLLTSSGSAVTVAGTVAATSYSGTTVTASGAIAGATLSGNGSAITALNAGNISSGTIDNARTTGTSSSTANTLVMRDGSGGFSMGALNSGNISAGATLIAGNRTTHTQGLNLEWNKDGGGGMSYLLNQKGTGGGGMIFGEVSTANVITETMRLTGSQRVGIQFSNPLAPLHVGNSVANSFTLEAFMDGNGALNVSQVRNDLDHGIIAEKRIRAVAYDVSSDSRIKNVIHISDKTEDLARLLKIEITDFTFKDKLSNGGRAQKKVIAQQVEQVYPDAVTRTTGVVPDLFQKATAKAGWISLNTTLKQGDRVRLMAKNHDSVHEVLEVEADRFRTDWNVDSEAVFVYGREVKDFRVVDYEALAMLNVSATQEIARQLAAKDAEITALRDEVARLKADKKSLTQTVSTVEERLLRIEKVLGEQSTIQKVKAEGRKTVALD